MELLENTKQCISHMNIFPSNVNVQISEVLQLKLHVIADVLFGPFLFLSD
jgi:hypothetical protein